MNEVFCSLHKIYSYRFVIYDAKQVAVKFIVKLNIKSARYL